MAGSIKITVTGVTHGVSASLEVPFLYIQRDARQAGVLIRKAGVGR
jgi:hypothetical protein